MDNIQWPIVPHTGRRVTRCRPLHGAHHVFNDRFPIDRKIQSQPYFWVIEGFSPNVDPVEVNSFGGVNSNQLGVLPAIIRNLVQRDFLGLMQLTGPESALFGIIVFDRVKIDPVKFHIRCVPVERIADQFDHVIFLPGLEDERTSSNIVTWTRPLGIALVYFAKFQNRFAMNRIPGGMQKRREEVGSRSDQLESQVTVIQSFYTDLIEIGYLPFRVVSGPFEYIKRIDVWSSERLRKHALAGKDKVLSRNQISVRPFGVVAQMKIPNRVIVIVLPTICQTG